MAPIYIFTPAAEADLPAVFGLINDRIHWMDEQGIIQWNKSGYWKAWPPEHYRTAVREGRLFVLKDGGRVAGSVTLNTVDPRWDDGANACYIHNLVAALDAHGAGDAILRFCEEKAIAEGRDFLRLDCSHTNPRLNEYYEAHGFVLVGESPGTVYSANLREKKLRG